MNKKRLARVIIAAVVTVAILVAIIVGCGPKWGDGSVNANASNAGNSNSAGGSSSSGTSGSGTSDDSSTNYATRASVQLPSYYMENMVFQRGKTLAVRGTVTTSQRGKTVDPTQLVTTISQGKKSSSAQAKISKKGDFTCNLPEQKAIFINNFVQRSHFVDSEKRVCRRRFYCCRTVEYGIELFAILRGPRQ